MRVCWWKMGVGRKSEQWNQTLNKSKVWICHIQMLKVCLDQQYSKRVCIYACVCRRKRECCSERKGRRNISEEKEECSVVRWELTLEEPWENSRKQDRKTSQTAAKDWAWETCRKPQRVITFLVPTVTFVSQVWFYIWVLLNHPSLLNKPCLYFEFCSWRGKGTYRVWGVALKIFTPFIDCYKKL